MLGGHWRSPKCGSKPINLIVSQTTVWLLRGRRTRFAVGHMALGYILGKASAKFLKMDLNVAAVMVFSIIPDIDILIPIIQHRGPAHSLITALVIFLPIFAIYRLKAAPYLLALISHSLIGDYFVGGRIQLFWPVMTQQYGVQLSIISQTNITLEWLLFLVSMVVMLKSKDLFKFFQPNNSNLLLSIPTFTVLLPTFFGFPLNVPAWLVLPHLVYLAMFSASMVIVAFHGLKSP